MIEKIAKEINQCTDCSLCENRTKTVPGVFPEESVVLLVGEAPGEDEDKTGIPFVGRAGKKLDEILMSLGVHREKLSITNIAKCRPPDNRNPHKEEIEACKKYLYRQIYSLRPILVVAMGRIAANTLLGKEISVTETNGKSFLYKYKDDGTFFAILVTPHPSAVLHQAKWYDILRKNLIALKKPGLILHNLSKKTFLSFSEEVPCLPLYTN